MLAVDAVLALHHAGAVSNLLCPHGVVLVLINNRVTLLLIGMAEQDSAGVWFHLHAAGCIMCICRGRLL